MKTPPASGYHKADNLQVAKLVKAIRSQTPVAGKEQSYEVPPRSLGVLPVTAAAAPAEDRSPTVLKKALRGFAAMDPDLQRQIASAGGRTAHAIGTARHFTSEEARAAGAKSRRDGKRNKSAPED